jgi:RNA polymerase sigma-70 factor (ECF subfamily)
VSVIDVQEAIVRAHREEWAPVVAALARRFGDLDIAEEMAAEAFATAVERWPVDGVPPNRGGWLTTTAHRKAIDRVRREARREEKHKEALMLSDTQSGHTRDGERSTATRLSVGFWSSEISRTARSIL